MSDIEPYSSLDELKQEHALLLEALDDECEAKYAQENYDGERDFILVNQDRIITLLRRGAATGKLLFGLQERGPAQQILDKWATSAFREGLKNLSHVSLVEYDEQAAPFIPDSECPYLGLEAFGESDVNRFFGRDERVNDLVKAVAEQRIVFVVGASGSGKSSMVLAGLIPKLKGGALPGSADWKYPPE
jgi:hypothetical protein